MHYFQPRGPSGSLYRIDVCRRETRRYTAYSSAYPTDVHPILSATIVEMLTYPPYRSQSLLLPLPVPPTSLPSLYTALEESIRPALAPAGRVLALVAANPHRELFERVWEKAKTDEPRKLLVVAWGRVMENFFGGEDGGEGRGEGSRGKGKDEKR